MKRKFILVSSIASYVDCAAFISRKPSPQPLMALPLLFDSPLGAEQSYTSGGDDDGDDDMPMQNISDEEALLACRAFLQRRNKLKNGWSLHQTRKKKLQNSLALGNNRTLSDMRGKMDESIGYFWEDPTELKYMRTGRPRLFFEESIDEFIESSTDGSNNDNDDMSSFYYSNGNEDVNPSKGDNDDEEEQSNFVSNEDDPDGVFTGFPTSPPPDFTARSFSKKRLFQNPEWKREWYEARWGNLRQDREAEKKKKRIEKYIQQIPSDILTSPQLDALTDDEIEDAIKTYIIANRKRSIAQRRRIHRKKKILEKSPMERLGLVFGLDEVEPSTKESNVLNNKTDSTLDSFISYLDGYNNSTHVQSLLQEDRRRRSQRAMKAYQTRLKNSNLQQIEKRQQKTVYSTTVFVSNRNVNESLERIRKTLDERSYPAMDDLLMILKPKRLKGRKNLLQEILLKCFGLRGKCIPNLNLEDYELEEFYLEYQPQLIEKMEKKFVSTSSIQELAYFISYNLRLTNITVY